LAGCKVAFTAAKALPGSCLGPDRGSEALFSGTYLLYHNWAEAQAAKI